MLCHFFSLIYTAAHTKKAVYFSAPEFYCLISKTFFSADEREILLIFSDITLTSFCV